MTASVSYATFLREKDVHNKYIHAYIYISEA